MKDNYLWVIEEYYDGEWHNTTIVACTRKEIRQKQKDHYYIGVPSHRVRKYIRQEK